MSTTIKATAFTTPSNQPSSKIAPPKTSSPLSAAATVKSPIDPPYDSQTAIREAAAGATYLKSGTSGDSKGSTLIGVA